MWKEDNILIKKIVEKMGLSKSTVTSILDRLKEDGHLLRNILPL
ncbi:MAG: MarR family transcriptional regulator [Candidatus Lokiarchaeota archaeon]|nr:MarR family transcriptional regulator [Candidatus Lokiarchaeota archaeon]